MQKTFILAAVLATYAHVATAAPSSSGLCVVSQEIYQPWSVFCSNAASKREECDKYPVYCTYQTGASSSVPAPVATTTSAVVQSTEPVEPIQPSTSGSCVPKDEASMPWKAHCDGADTSKCATYSAFCKWNGDAPASSTSVVEPTTAVTSTAVETPTASSSVETPTASTSVVPIPTEGSVCVVKDAASMPWQALCVGADYTKCTTALSAYCKWGGDVPTSTSAQTATTTDVTTATATTTMPPAPAPTFTDVVPVPNTRVSNNQFVGIYMLTWASGWTAPGIQKFFSDIVGQADIAFVTFFRTTPAGLDCTGQSPCASVWSPADQKEVPASQIYKKAIQESRASHGMKTMLSIGGWTYRDDFKFLAHMSEEQVFDWALKVKATVDEFDADGLDIDYEAETAEQWYYELVQTNVIGQLRKAMPDKLIALTIGGIAAAYGTPAEVTAAFNPPLNTVYKNAGIALPVINQNYNDLDYVQLMTYDGEPNMDPRVCMDLTAKAFMSWGVEASLAARKVAMGAELGGQFGACSGVTLGWCNQNLPLVSDMADDVAANKYAGLFFWPNLNSVESAPYYAVADDKVGGNPL